MRQLMVIMGSGETSPTMVNVHKDVARGPAVLLDTPYGFQENVADISARARAYFARSVGLEVEVAPDPAALRNASWIFSGPGSPTYALREWEGAVASALRDHVRGREATIVFASAAACTLGRFAVPVYEIYKVGADPHWVPGLDLLAEYGLDVVVIPHYDNAEGGTHDTRYSYLGERRLRVMERELPEGTAVLGIDEHTAVLIGERRVEVRGRGWMTVRRHGDSTAVPSGTVMELDELRALLRGGGASARAGAQPPVVEESVPLKDVVLGCRRRFEAGERVEAILAVEAAVAEWGADTEEDEGADWARAVMRDMIVRLGRAAALEAVLPELVEVRQELRRRGLYPLADRVRAALAAGGVELRDTPDGTVWA
ncbi:hypothetical protein ACIBF1_03860 [Spirillospora sp. NPDC050679]